MSLANCLNAQFLWKCCRVICHKMTWFLLSLVKIYLHPTYQLPNQVLPLPYKVLKWVGNEFMLCYSQEIICVEFEGLTLWKSWEMKYAGVATTALHQRPCSIHIVSLLLEEEMHKKKSTAKTDKDSSEAQWQQKCHPEKAVNIRLHSAPPIAAPCEFWSMFQAPRNAEEQAVLYPIATVASGIRFPVNLDQCFHALREIRITASSGVSKTAGL